MHFTREPVIETVITPKEGSKLAIRNSKGVAQEEFFVDSIEVVSFGNSFFYRSTERPKSFLVPVGDYEVLEVRETRMVVKHVSSERAIKIAPKEAQASKGANQTKEKEKKRDEETEKASGEGKTERKRERRRQRRRRGSKEETEVSDQEYEAQEGCVELPQPQMDLREESKPVDAPAPKVAVLLPPPSTLISEQLAKREKVAGNSEGKTPEAADKADKKEVGSREDEPADEPKALSQRGRRGSYSKKDKEAKKAAAEKPKTEEEGQKPIEKGAEAVEEKAPEGIPEVKAEAKVGAEEALSSAAAKPESSRDEQA